MIEDLYCPRCVRAVEARGDDLVCPGCLTPWPRHEQLREVLPTRRDLDRWTELQFRIKTGRLTEQLPERPTT